MIKKDIESIIKKVLEEEKIPTEALLVETSEHADYTTNIALRLGKFGKYHTPIEIANFLVRSLPKSPLISQVKVAPPGFINFTINQKETIKLLPQILNDIERYGYSEINKGKKARVEFVSANPTGPLHLGNARGGPLGDSLAFVLEASGYEVIREYYNNNIGSQVDIFGNSLIGLIKEELGLGKVESNEKTYQGIFIEELASKLIKEMNLSQQASLEEEKVKARGVEILFEEIIATCRQMGIEFDEIYHESEVQKELTLKVIEELKKKGLTKEKEGALWFAPNDEFLADKEAVLERSDRGRPTYFADDIAYHKIKFENKPDLVVNVLGSNHHGHVPRLLAAIKALGEDVNKYKVILYQYVRLKKGEKIVKMSKRAGNFITADEVLEEVGKDAFRFFLLMHAPNTHMDFDLDLAKETSADNPVYYVQYAHARMNSILKKAPEGLPGANLNLLSSPQEGALTKKILQFPEVIEEISTSFAVHQLPFYAIKLAELFHSFYETHKVISEDPEMTQARLTLVQATKITLANCLKLMGVSAPERM
ncbi:MAG TPA: arginine--tRNA ligase [Candidatus Nanoarchaeia archaeon]|nr:arginine--tRNA ligase [uncultured archaeon]